MFGKDTGAVRLIWARFTVWDALGETNWQTHHVSFGFVHVEHLPELCVLVVEWVRSAYRCSSGKEWLSFPCQSPSMGVARKRVGRWF